MLVFINRVLRKGESKPKDNNFDITLNLNDLLTIVTDLADRENEYRSNFDALEKRIEKLEKNETKSPVD